MKKIIFLLAMVAFSIPGFSQVGIGTTNPHRSSMLDVVSDTAGFLPPRVTDAQMWGIGWAVAGLMVYNTTYNQYYYFDDVSWNPITGSGSGWLLTGNSTLDPWNHFLGTVDTSALRFRVNNDRAGIIDYGKRSTSLGYRSLYNNSAYDNSAFGEEALHNNTTGEMNTAFGAWSLHANTTGWGNVAIGNGTLESNVEGNENTALGYIALQQNTGNQNTAIGAWSQFQNSGGGGNTATGVGSLSWNENGNGNTALGFNTLNKNQADNNTAVGYSAMFQNRSGTGNVAVGFNALTTNEDGYSNTAIGFEAMLNDSASENTAIGFEAMHENTTGTGNVAVGQTALRENIEGSFNTAVGWDAMKNAHGDHNVAIGNSSLKELNSGEGNIAIGRDALFVNLTGSNNTMVGTLADFDALGPYDITNSTAIGFEARVTESDQVRLGNNDIQTLFCMGAYNSTTMEPPNLYVSPDGQIMRVYLPTKTPSRVTKTVTSDVTAIPANSSRKVRFDIEGCQPGHAVYTSPSDELPDGLVIAYTRVSAPGQVEVKFTNTTDQNIDLAEMKYFVTILN